MFNHANCRRPKKVGICNCLVSRSRAGPSHFLSDFKGRLQTDGYEVYTALGVNTAEDQIHTLLPENWKPPTV